MSIFEFQILNWSVRQIQTILDTIVMTIVDTIVDTVVMIIVDVPVFSLQQLLFLRRAFSFRELQ